MDSLKFGKSLKEDGDYEFSEFVGFNNSLIFAIGRLDIHSKTVTFWKRGYLRFKISSNPNSADINTSDQVYLTIDTKAFWRNQFQKYIL